jgi:hypothetical protein
MVVLADIIGRGLAASRPAAGTEGRLYYSTDTAVLERDNGSSWDSVEGTGTPADHSHTAGGDGGVLTNDQHDGYSDWTEISAPATPSANIARLYAADDGGLTKLYYVDSAGTVYELPTIVSGGSGSGAPSNATYVTTTANSGLSSEVLLSAVIMSGLDAAKPAFGVAGRLYYATDDDVLYRDSGTGWDNVTLDWTEMISGKPTIPPENAKYVTTMPSSGLTDEVVFSSLVLRGVAASRPGANSDLVGRLYYSTDTNVLERDNGTTWDAMSSTSGDGHVIEDEGTPLTARTKLNFVGAGVTVTDDSGDDASVVTIPGGGTGHVIEDEGTPLTARSKLNFVGAGVAVTDDSGDDASVVTISGGGGGGTTYVGSMVPVDEEILGAPAASVTLTVPSGYRDMVLKWTARGTDGSAQLVRARFNGDTGTSYDWNLSYHTGTSVASQNSGTGATSLHAGAVPPSGSPAGSLGSGEMTIFDYAGTTLHKSAVQNTGRKDSAAAGGLTGIVIYGVWRNTAAITSITLFPDAGNFAAGSKFTLYGLGGSAGAAAEHVSTLNFVIDGDGATIATGIKGDLVVDFACTITGVTLLADQSGSIVVDVWKDTYANFPPTDADSITASAPPTITTATKSQDTTLTGWTTSIAAGDILRFNVDSVTSIQRATVALTVARS